MARDAAREDAEFGDLLRRFRTRAGLTQEELAERAGLSARGISDLERGQRRHPRPDTTRLLIDALEISAIDRSLLLAAARPSNASTTTARTTPFGAPPVRITPLVSVDALDGARLPAPPNAFVGREAEIAAALNLVRTPATRLLTLLGPGGVGKTRLALRLADELRADFSDGVAFVALADIADPALLPITIGRAVGIHMASRYSVEERIVTVFRDRRVLLVLDNFEHLRAAAPLVARVLAACPHVKILVTSREPLRLSGEYRFPVSPLPVPAAAHETSLDTLANYGAVALFIQRARQVQPTFALSPANAETITTICRRLDGLPLAIELAAARVAILPPAAILARLEQRLPLLVDGPQDAPNRHRTMHAAIAWSHDLLSVEERVCFRRLAVFTGSFTLAAAEAVGDGAPTSGIATLEAVRSLVEKNLLHPTEDLSGDPRFVMLETVREFAQALLDASPAPEPDRLRRAHAAFYLAYAQGIATTIPRRWDRHQSIALDAEYPNLRSALEWALVAGETEMAAGLAVALTDYWLATGLVAEGRRWLEQVLASGESLPSSTRASVLVEAGLLARFQADYDRAATYLELALTLHREAEDRPGIAGSLYHLAFVVEERGNLVRAADMGEQALALYRDLGDHHGIGRTLSFLGLVYRQRGQPTTAGDLLGEAIPLLRQADDLSALADALSRLGMVAEDAADDRTAASLHRQSLGLARQLGQKWRIVYTLADVAVVLGARDDDLSLAAQLFGAAEALRHASGIELSPAEQTRYDGASAAVRAKLGHEAFMAAWNAGQSRPLMETIAVALYGAPEPEGDVGLTADSPTPAGD